MTDKLKPCPFCGGEAELLYRENYSAHQFWRVECNNCDCRTASYEDEPGKNEAIAAWNRRVEDESCEEDFADNSHRKYTEECMDPYETSIDPKGAGYE